MTRVLTIRLQIAFLYTLSYTIARIAYSAHRRDYQHRSLDNRYLLIVSYVADKSIVMRAFRFHDVRLSRIRMKPDESFRASSRDGYLHSENIMSHV